VGNKGWAVTGQRVGYHYFANAPYR